MPNRLDQSAGGLFHKPSPGWKPRPVCQNSPFVSLPGSLFPCLHSWICPKAKRQRSERLFLHEVLIMICHPIFPYCRDMAKWRYSASSGQSLRIRYAHGNCALAPTYPSAWAVQLQRHTVGSFLGRSLHPSISEQLTGNNSSLNI